MEQLQLSKQISVLCRLWLAWNSEVGSCVGVRSQRKNIQLSSQNICSRLEWEQREEEHTHAQKLACQMVISVGFSCSRSYSPDQTHGSNMMCSLGPRKVSAIGSWGGGNWMGTSALGSHLKSHLIAWGKHLGCTPQTTSGAISGERLGKLKRKEEGWV